MLLFAHPQAGLGDEVAERQRLGQVVLARIQMRLHFFDHQFQGGLEGGELDGEVVTPQPGEFYGGWVTSSVVGPFKGAPGTLGW